MFAFLPRRHEQILVREQPVHTHYHVGRRKLQARRRRTQFLGNVVAVGQRRRRTIDPKLSRYCDVCHGVARGGEDGGVTQARERTELRAAPSASRRRRPAFVALMDDGIKP